jgi:hypothetical protein
MGSDVSTSEGGNGRFTVTTVITQNNKGCYEYTGKYV